jgi:hypothetical protein
MDLPGAEQHNIRIFGGISLVLKIPGALVSGLPFRYHT